MTLLTRRGLAASLAGLAVLPRAGRAASDPVRIGYQKNGSLVILRQQDGLRGLGAPVQWVEFPSGPPILEALAAGALEFAATGDTPPLFAQAAGAPLLYVGGQPIAGANQAILVQKDGPVKTLADLRGRRLAYTKGSSAHALVAKALASAGMTPADVQSIYLQPPDAAAAFRRGALDAWAVWDPFYAMAQAEPGTAVLTTAEGVAPSNSFFLASHRFAETRPDTVQAMLDAINGAARWAQANPDALAQTMAEVTGVPLAAQRIAAPRGVYAVQPMDAAIIARQQELADLFFKLHILPTAVDVKSAVWTPPHQGERT